MKAMICTFETLVRRFSLKNKGLRQLAQIVHAADIEDEKFPRTEGDGLLAVLRGWGKQGLTDAEKTRVAGSILWTDCFQHSQLTDYFGHSH